MFRERQDMKLKFLSKSRRLLAGRLSRAASSAPFDGIHPSETSVPVHRGTSSSRNMIRVSGASSFPTNSFAHPLVAPESESIAHPSKVDCCAVGNHGLVSVCGHVLIS